MRRNIGKFATLETEMKKAAFTKREITFRLTVLLRELARHKMPTAKALVTEAIKEIERLNAEVKDAWDQRDGFVIMLGIRNPTKTD